MNLKGLKLPKIVIKEPPRLKRLIIIFFSKYLLEILKWVWKVLESHDLGKSQALLRVSNIFRTALQP